MTKLILPPTLRYVDREDFSFAVGQLLRRDTTIFEIANLKEDYVVLHHVITNERKFVPLDVLYKEYSLGRLIPCEGKDITRAANGDLFTEDESRSVSLPFIKASDAAKERLEFIEKFIYELRSYGYKSLKPSPLLELDFRKVKQTILNRKTYRGDTRMTLSTLYKWSRKIEANNGDLMAALPLYSDRGGKNGSRDSPEVQSAIRKSIAYLQENQKAKICYSRIQNVIQSEIRGGASLGDQLCETPSLSKVTRAIKENFTPFEIMKRNRGLVAAKKEYRDHFPRDRAQFPLEVIEFDDKDTRVFCIDETNGLPYGRAFITSGIDQFSSVMVGASIGTKPRSTWSALSAFANTVMPKYRTMSNYEEVQSAVEFYGIGGILVFDNALYNHSAALKYAIAEVSKSICAFSTPYTPTEKSIVEDFNGRMSTFLSTLPGFGGEKSSKDGLSNGVSGATMTIQAFKRQFLAWTYDQFCNTPRVGGLTPRQKWHLGMQNITPRIPRNLTRLRTAIAIEHTVCLRPDGLLFSGLVYQSDDLITLRKAIGSKTQMEFRYHPENLREAYVLDPRSDSFIVVRSVNPEYTSSTTFFQHKLVRKMAAMNGKRNPALKELLSHRFALQRLVAQAKNSGKRRERKWANYVGPLEPSREVLTSGIEVVSDLEYQVDSIREVVMESGDEGWDLPADF